MISNQSRLAELEKCPRRYFWRYVCDLEPQYPNVKAFLGNAMHTALAEHYRGGQAVSAYETALQGWEQKDHPEFVKGSEKWRKVLEGYLKRYPTEEFEVLMVPEQELVVPMGPHQLAVRVDLIVKRPGAGVWVMDHKTTSRTGASWYSQFFIDKQGSAYTYAAGKALGVEVEGWLINVLKDTKEETYERQAFSRTQRQLQRFEKQTIEQLDRLTEALGEGEGVEPVVDEGWQDLYFPQFTHECHTFGDCPFLALCQTGRAALPIYKARRLDYVDGYSAH